MQLANPNLDSGTWKAKEALQVQTVTTLVLTKNKSQPPAQVYQATLLHLVIPSIETNMKLYTSIVVAIAAQGVLGSWFSKAGKLVRKERLGLVLTKQPTINGMRRNLSAGSLITISRTLRHTTARSLSNL